MRLSVCPNTKCKLVAMKLWAVRLPRLRLSTVMLKDPWKAMITLGSYSFMILSKSSFSPPEKIQFAQQSKRIGSSGAGCLEACRKI